MPADPNYDKPIADAGRAFVEAKNQYDLTRSEEDRKTMELAWDKLYWMVQADKYLWNANEYRTET